MSYKSYRLTAAICVAGILSACGSHLESEVSFQRTDGQKAMTTDLMTQVSPHSFDDTLAKVRAAIEKRPLKLFAEIDHAKGAQSADLELTPSTLFVFGNPKGGTPLMARNPQMGIELPLKIHVYQTAEGVTVSYPNIKALAQSYGLDSTEPPVPNIANMLDDLVGEVTAE